MPDIEVFFIRWQLAFMGSVVSPDEKTSFKLYMYIQNYERFMFLSTFSFHIALKRRNCCMLVIFLST